VTRQHSNDIVSLSATYLCSKLGCVYTKRMVHA